MSRRCVVSAILVVLVSGLSAPSSIAATGRTCPGGAPVTTFKVTARPTAGGQALPLSALNVIEPDETLVYEPTGTIAKTTRHAGIALILIPEDSTFSPRVLQAYHAGHRAEWPVPVRATAIGVVYGPQGVDEKKLNALLRNDPAAIDRLADYADQTSKVEALVQALSKYEQSAPDTASFQGVLNGFSSQYGVSLPPIDRTKPVDQQASALLRALTPALAPTASRPTLVQQSGSLAAAVASLFFGPPAGLAIGGVSMVGNLHTSLFPPADFQSAFTQNLDSGGVALCTGTTARDAHARIQFVWMLRLPDMDPPLGCHVEPAHLAAAWTGDVTIHCESVAKQKALSHVRDWRLVAGPTTLTVPAAIKGGETGTELALDLKPGHVAAGEYHLAAMWDWTPLAIAGTITVHPLADFSSVAPSPESEDHLIAGTGVAEVRLGGADFEFVNRVGLAAAEKSNDVKAVEFVRPSHMGVGEQRTLTATIDARNLTPGRYVLAMTQVNASRHDIPITVHPPNPTLASVPVRVNVGETHQRVVLHGTSLERIDRIASHDATWTLRPVRPKAHNVTEREAEIHLEATAQAGERVSIEVFVEDLHNPIEMSGALEVVGPRPAITEARASIINGLGVEVRKGELPADAPVRFALKTRGAGPHPVVRLACEQDGAVALTVASGQKTATATLDFLDQGTLFLSVGAATLGPSGCALDATVTNEATGVSDRYPLGTMVRFPHIDAFSIGTSKIGDGVYAGTLVGEGLETVEKTGWNGSAGSPVQGLAAPVPGQFGKQMLDIAVPWPPPAPHAPLYIWLRGERDGRATSVRY